jgi:NADPH-dependent F420 reductase
MNVTVLGTGNMARAITKFLLAGGNNVTLVSRDAEKAAAVVKELAQFAQKGASVESATYNGSISGEVVINTIWYPVCLEVLSSSREQLMGKILVDISNPVNQAYDDLVTPPGSSAAEEIARTLPVSVKVLKAFNTTYAGVLTQGSLADQPLDVFIAGDDAQAKETLAKLVEAGGQRPIDVGPLRRARLLESLGLLSILLQSKQEKPWMTGFKIMG